METEKALMKVEEKPSALVKVTKVTQEIWDNSIWLSWVGLAGLSLGMLVAIVCSFIFRELGPLIAFLAVIKYFVPFAIVPTIQFFRRMGDKLLADKKRPPELL